MSWVEIVMDFLVSAGAIVGAISGSYLAHKKATALMEYRLQKLEEEVRKLTAFIEKWSAHDLRLGKLEVRVEILESDVKDLKKEKTK